MVFYCCVPLCKNTNKHQKMHVFPRNETIYKSWLQQLQNPKLFLLERAKVQTNFRVCDVHFVQADRIIGRRGANLKFDSIPKLYLPLQTEVSSCDEQMKHSITVADTEEHSGNINERTNDREPKTLIVADEQAVEGSSLVTITTPSIETSTLRLKSSERCQDLSRRSKILHSLGVKTKVHLTPKARKLYKIVGNLRKTAKRLFVQRVNLKKRLKQAEDFLVSSDYLALRLNTTAYNFVKTQLRLQKIYPKGRRFSVEDKLFAMTLMKNSPKGYRLLCNYFALPSIKTLNNLLRQVPFDTGINRPIMNSLKKKVQNMKTLDRYCTIIFDEIALEPSLTYNTRKDIFIGFQDNGSNGRSPIFADKAMVFMARGIHKKWKQPLCYFLNGGGMKAACISKYIKIVIQEARSIGLNVIGIVCDQCSANTKAINTLYEDSRRYCILNGIENIYFGFLVDGKEVIPFYDSPHLLKGIRNNLFVYNCRFKWRNNKTEIASWADIRRLYELEEDKCEYKMLNKLTDAHINNLKKMKVSIAAQVLSQRVAATMRGLARLGPQHMPSSGIETAEFLFFMDKVFDSVNGAAVIDKSGKELRCAVTKNTKHVEFWVEAVKVFESIEFFNEKRTQLVPPSVKNWKHSLKAFLYLWGKLQDEGFRFLCPRNINQDPVENLFGRIRSHGARNIYPNCNSFIASFKSIVVGGVVSLSSNSNCEDDEVAILHSLNDFFTEEIYQEPILLEDILEYIVIPKDLNYSILQNSTLTYIAGFIARKVLKNIKGCNICKFDLVGKIDQLSEKYRIIIESRSFRPSSLLSPTTTFIKLFMQCIYVLENALPRVCYKNNVARILKFLILSSIEKTLLSCTKHHILDLFVTSVVEFHLYTWSKNINKILNGKVHNVKTNDPIKLLARQQCLKHRKYSDKIKNA